MQRVTKQLVRFAQRNSILKTSNLIFTTTVFPPSGSQSPSIELSLCSSTLPPLKPDEILVRVEAAPINPSDVYQFLQFADLKTLTTSTDKSTGYPLTRATLPRTTYTTKTSIVSGNEGAGEVIEAGENKEAQRLIGKKVALFAWEIGGMYATHKIIKASAALELLPGTTAAEGASCFINPLTALGFVELMRTEGYKGIVHTAAASQLGQMLVKLCQAEDIPLVNIVRRTEQLELLKKIGAKYVFNSTSSTFEKDLENAIAETGAYLAFDALGGGPTINTILTVMERAAARGQPYSRYGSSVEKRLFIYGGLDPSPTILNRTYGLRWTISRFLFFDFLARKVSPERLKNHFWARIASEIKTTFSTSYDQEISLTEMLQPDIIRKYASTTTGSKCLVNPSKTKITSSKL